MYQHKRESSLPSYEIVLEGTLDKDWSEWLEGLEITHEGDRTILRGKVRDQAALRGLLAKVWDLNRTVVLMSQVEDPQPKQEETKMDKNKQAKTKRAPAAKPLPPGAVIAGPQGNVPAETGDCMSEPPARRADPIEAEFGPESLKKDPLDCST